MKAVGPVLDHLRPSVRKIDSDSQIEEFANGEICLMLTWGTNVMVARARAEEAGIKADLRFVIPHEGAISWMDTLAIPADAPHSKDAHAFLDYLMRPDVAAANANYIRLPTVNKAALPLITQSLRDDPAVYPPPEVMARLKPFKARSLEQSRIDTDIWRHFRTGQ